MEVTRTFDIIRYSHEKYPREDMYCGKVDGKWIKYSSADVVETTDLVSLGLLAMGFKKGDKIGTITPNKPEWNFADAGIAQAGMIHVPIYPTIGSDEYTYILDHSDVKALIVGNKAIYNKVSPIVARIGRKIEIFSFDPVENVRSFAEIIEEGKKKCSHLRGCVERYQLAHTARRHGYNHIYFRHYRKFQGSDAEPLKPDLKCEGNHWSP